MGDGMDVIPAIDVTGGRSRVVYWPGASAGVGTPTDRPDRIAALLVGQGARIIHLVDVDGARRSAPANLQAVGAVAARVAVPLQVAGGLEDADHIRLAFAAGATRVVLSAAIADRPEALAECLAVAGDWLAVGLDPRPERIAAFPWRRSIPPTFDTLVDELVAGGVRRLVLGHGGTAPDPGLLEDLVRRHDIDLLVAGGATDLAGVSRLRDAGVAGLILGEALLSGAIDLPRALEAAA
jgi:phosphoribosylformimino-5-aminoimidazole carboxamide ribotide isomerase